jgi:hypothetical protein
MSVCAGGGGGGVQFGLIEPQPAGEADPKGGRATTSCSRAAGMLSSTCTDIGTDNVCAWEGTA